LIICGTGPIVSAVNRAERRRHLFAAELLARLGRDVIVAWPVLVEVDLLLRARGYAPAAITFAESLAAGIHRLEAPTAAEFALSLKLAKRHPDSGADIPDLIVMAMASLRDEDALPSPQRSVRVAAGPMLPLSATVTHLGVND
jgi:predicted nucleic acid-binding protein